jgi:hypothetical protein
MPKTQIVNRQAKINKRGRAIRKVASETESSTCFVSRSAPFVAERIAKAYGSNFFSWKRVFSHITAGAIHASANLFIVGLYCKGDFKAVFSQYKTLTSYFNKTIIVFAGTDLMQLKAFSSKERRLLLRMLLKNKTAFFGVGKYAQEEAWEILPELAALGAEVGVLYFPMQHTFPNKLPAMPRKFSIGCYMPPSAADFYGFDVIKPASILIPSVRFHLYSLQGAGREQYKLPSGSYKNIICHSSKIESPDMANFIKGTACGLRLTKHDGNPMSLAEYNSMGRWFIYNKKMPYCEFLKDRDPKKLVSLINELRTRQGLNTEGSSFYRERHDSGVFLDNIKTIYKGI